MAKNHVDFLGWSEEQYKGEEMSFQNLISFRQKICHNFPVLLDASKDSREQHCFAEQCQGKENSGKYKATFSNFVPKQCVCVRFFILFEMWRKRRSQEFNSLVCLSRSRL